MRPSIAEELLDLFGNVTYHPDWDAYVTEKHLRATDEQAEKFYPDMWEDLEVYVDGSAINDRDAIGTRYWASPNAEPISVEVPT